MRFSVFVCSFDCYTFDICSSGIFMDQTVLNNQGLSFRIKDWTLDAYRRVLENEMIWRDFLIHFSTFLAFTAFLFL